MRNRILTIAIILTCTTVFAQNSRSAVSLTGADSNPCTTTQPCRSFTAAINATSPGGDIIALDSGGYGPFAISKSISVAGAPGIHAAITASSGSAININGGASDTVMLRNLVLIGSGATEGLSIASAGSVNLSDMTISGFTQNGVDETSSIAVVTLDKCRIMGNGNIAVNVGSTTKTVITHSEFVGNSTGLYLSGSGKMTVSGCILARNAVGVDSSGLTSDMFVEDSALVDNSVAAWAGSVNGAGVLRLSNNVIYGNGIGVQTVAGGTVYTYGNNAIDFNDTNVDASTTMNVITQR